MKSLVLYNSVENILITFLTNIDLNVLSGADALQTRVYHNNILCILYVAMKCHCHSVIVYEYI